MDRVVIGWGFAGSASSEGSRAGLGGVGAGGATSASGGVLRGWEFLRGRRGKWTGPRLRCFREWMAVSGSRGQEGGWVGRGGVGGNRSSLRSRRSGPGY